jgi:hypothetical protein
VIEGRLLREWRRWRGTIRNSGHLNPRISKLIFQIIGIRISIF